MISPSDTRSINRLGRTFNVTTGNASFWNDFANGTWEPETLAILDHYVTAETLYLDIGTWIGPTLLFSAQRARHAVGFEPDPVAFGELEANFRSNPSLKNTQIHRCAISTKNGVISMGSQSNPGDSMSSVLFASKGKGWESPARRLKEFEADWPTAPRCFVKIDIEGGEFTVVPTLISFLRRKKASVFLSLHQPFFMQPYTGRGFFRKLIGEFLLLRRILGLYRLVRLYPYIYHGEQRLTARDFLRRRNWRYIQTILLAHEPPPWALNANSK